MKARHVNLKLLMLTLISICFVFAVRCNKTEVNGYWAETQITIDGDLSDWDTGKTLYIQDQDVLLGIANDSTNMYLVFKFSNIEWARAVMITGLTLWIDEEGGSDKIFGMRNYPGKKFESLPDSLKPDRNPEFDNDRMKILRERLSENRPEFSIIDNKSEQVIPIPTDGAEGPAVASEFSDGFFTFEYKIPLNLINADYYGIEVIPGEEISFGLICGEMDQMRLMGAGRGGRPEGEFGEFGGGRPGGGMRPNLRDLPEKKEFWFKTKLLIEK